MSVMAQEGSQSAKPKNQFGGFETEEMYERYKKMVSKFVPYDPRFPNQNQTRNCQQNYIDYHRCLNKKDENYCAWYKNAYTQLCPPEWYEKWDEQRENGIFPVRLT